MRVILDNVGTPREVEWEGRKVCTDILKNLDGEGGRHDAS
jgi:hypothetical protein